MTVPLWLVVLLVGYLGIRLTHTPWWLVAVLLLAGYLTAGTFIGSAIDSALH